MIAELFLSEDDTLHLSAFSPKRYYRLKKALVKLLYVRILRVLLCVWFSPELWFSAKHCEV